MTTEYPSNAYEEWEASKHLSPVSPEAYWAELAWNAALDRLLEYLAVSHFGDTTFETAIRDLKTSLKETP